ncbi:N-acetyltransferase family protein [Fusobacterium sp. PH5-44]|uniref:GNAT family N-acetyltransferase n=1 Tax=unclassified Fusobacterium TaxID=2648384 RepID=UPI003D1E6F8B
MLFKEITDLTLEKTQEIVELEKTIFEEGSVDPWLLKAFFHYGKIFVIEEDGIIISVAEYMASFSEKIALLYGVCTRKGYNSRGYGKKLLMESEKKLKEIGISQIELTVSPDNIRGLKLYESLGYMNIEFRKDEYGVGNDRFLYRKILK